MDTNLTDLASVLAYLAGPAGIVAWMIYTSNWFRNAVEAGTVKLSGWQLQLVIFVVSALPPTIAFVILAVVPPETLAQFATTYQFFATLFMAYLAQQAWFAVTKPNTTTKVTISAPAAMQDASGSSNTGGIYASVGPSTTTPAPVKPSITEVLPDNPPALYKSAAGENVTWPPPGG